MVWGLNKAQATELNVIMNKILKRILEGPPGTLYVETGQLEPKTTIKRTRINKEIKIKWTAN